MLAYMNREAWQQTVATRRATYWSTERKVLWVKGETSGHVQQVREILVDCDSDAVVLRIDQVGAACHHGYRSCFYRRAEGDMSAYDFEYEPAAPVNLRLEVLERNWDILTTQLVLVTK